MNGMLFVNVGTRRASPHDAPSSVRVQGNSYLLHPYLQRQIVTFQTHSNDNHADANVTRLTRQNGARASQWPKWRNKSMEHVHGNGAMAQIFIKLVQYDG
jgi:hypothetical protein